MLTREWTEQDEQAARQGQALQKQGRNQHGTRRHVREQAEYNRDKFDKLFKE